MSSTATPYKDAPQHEKLTIDPENNITAHASAKEAEAVASCERFETAAEFAKLAAAWPAERLVEIWNSLAGVTPVKKFKDRKSAAARIWKRLEGLAAETTTPRAPRAHVATSKPKSGHKTTGRKAARTAESSPQVVRSKKPSAVRTGSKTAQVIAMLEKPKGATLAELMKATDWQPHSIRGFISGTLGKKMKLTVTSAKRDDGERVYSLPK
jgi:hypothetical protein